MADLNDRDRMVSNRPVTIGILAIQRESHRLQPASSDWKIGATFDTVNQLPTSIARLKSKTHAISWISTATFRTRVLGP